MSLKLRDYQGQAILNIHERWEAGGTRVPAVMATGRGRTGAFHILLDEWLNGHPGERALISAPTAELIEQAVQKVKAVAPGRRVGVVKAAQNDVRAEVIVSSRQTLASAKRREQVKRVGLVIVDE